MTGQIKVGNCLPRYFPNLLPLLWILLLTVTVLALCLDFLTGVMHVIEQSFMFKQMLFTGNDYTEPVFAWGYASAMLSLIFL